MKLKTLSSGVNIHQAKGFGYLNADYDAIIIEFEPRCLHFRESGNGGHIHHANWMPKDIEVLQLVDALYNVSPTFASSLDEWYNKRGDLKCSQERNI